MPLFLLILGWKIQFLYGIIFAITGHFDYKTKMATNNTETVGIPNILLFNHMLLIILKVELAIAWPLESVKSHLLLVCIKDVL